MSHQAIQGLALIAMTVFIHAIGSVLFIWVLRKYQPFWATHWGFVVNVFSLTWVISFLVFLHLAEIIGWAAFYRLRGVFDTLEEAVYFSLVTFTTVGYGDVVLPQHWRLMGGCEAVVGILMSAWSTALLLGVVNKIHVKLARDQGLRVDGDTGMT